MDRAGIKVNGKRRGGREKQKQSRRERTEAGGAGGDRDLRVGEGAWEPEAGRREERRARERLPCLASVYAFTSLHCRR